jgi:eukaryotic-like serine/threonine-protein kinase
MGGRRIAGRYELVEQLGTSSWRALDTDLERDVLVRMPGRDVSAARLTHQGIVPLFDQGEEGGVPYAVYEFLAGGSLERRLAAGPLSGTEVDRVAAAVTAALAYAHEQGVTHGSIGPASVMLSADGDAKLTGFTGTGTPSEDDRALAALLETLGASAAAAPDEADVTAVLPPGPRPGRRRIVLALAALALVSAGIGAALLATSGESKPADSTTEPASVATSPGSTEEPVIVPPATTAEKTTTGTTTAPAPATTAPPTTALPTTAPAPATEPAPTTEPPATEPAPTTEPPPETTEPPPTTEAPPATTTTPTAAG